MKKKQDMREWQSDREADQLEKERDRKKKRLDDKANSYRVIQNGEIICETHQESEANRIASNINSLILWCIDGHGIRYIPITKSQ